MAAVTHLTPVVQTTLLTEVSTTYTTPPSPATVTLSNANFTAGKKYLLILNARVGGDQPNSLFSFRWVHGSTVFTDGEHIQEPSSSTAGRLFPFTYITVWTAEASEDVFFQMKAPIGQTARADSISLFAIQLDAELVENTDWFFAEGTTDEVVPNSFGQNIGSTVTINANGSDKWLVLGNTSADVNTTSQLLWLSMAFGTGAGTPTNNGPPEMRFEGESNSEVRVNALFRVFTPSAGQNTYGMRASLSANPRSGGQNYTIQSVRMFAINLALFADAETVWTEAAITIAEDSSVTTIATATALTATADSDFLILGYAHGTVSGAQTDRPHRMYIEDDLDGVMPAGDGDAATFHNDAYDVGEHMPLFSIAGPTFQNADGDHTVSLKGSVSGSSVMTQAHRSLAVVSMELTGGAPPAVTLLPDPTKVPITLPAPTVTFGTKTLTPDALAVPVVLPAPTLSFGTKTLSPDALAVPVVLPDPTVTFGTKTLTPDALAVPVVVPNVTVVVGGTPLVLNPDPVIVTIVIPDPTVTLGALTLTPDALAVPIVLPTPTVSVAKTLTPDALAVTIVLPNPTVLLGALTLTPDPVLVPILLPDVEVSAGINYVFSGEDITEVDVSKYRSGILFRYAAVLAAGAVGQAGRSRLFNITDSAEVIGSEVTYTGVTTSLPTLYLSNTFSLTGKKQYRPQHKADITGETCIWHSSKLGVVS